MTVLRSYVEGRWYAPDSGTPVYDAVTGDDVLTMVAKEWNA